MNKIEQEGLKKILKKIIISKTDEEKKIDFLKGKSINEKLTTELSSQNFERIDDLLNIASYLNIENKIVEDLKKRQDAYHAYIKKESEEMLKREKNTPSKEYRADDELLKYLICDMTTKKITEFDNLISKDGLYINKLLTLARDNNIKNSQTEKIIEFRNIYTDELVNQIRAEASEKEAKNIPFPSEILKFDMPANNPLSASSSNDEANDGRKEYKGILKDETWKVSYIQEKESIYINLFFEYTGNEYKSLDGRKAILKIKPKFKDTEKAIPKVKAKEIESIQKDKCLIFQLTKDDLASLKEINKSIFWIK